MAFPSSPTNGQQATVNNIVYVYNSTKSAWVRNYTNGAVLSINSLTVTSANTSTTTGTGAVIVTGGAGVGGNIYAGGLVNSAGGLQNTPIGNATPSTAIFTSESVSGNSTVGALTINNSATIGTTLGVSGALTGTTYTGTTYTATNSFNGPHNGTLGSAGGNTAIVSTLSATGNATVSGLAVNNSATVGTTLGVTGNAIFSSYASIGVTTPTAYLHIKAGTATASTAPLKLTSGTNLGTAEAGAIEYDGSYFYATPQTTNGRQLIPASSYYVLAANAAAVGTAIANVFPGTTAIPLVASGIYDIEYVVYFQKTTAGTLVWTILKDAVVTMQHAEMRMSPITGVTSTNAASELFAQLAQQTAASTAFVATGSLTNNANHYMRMRINLVNASATKLYLQVTNSAGTITPMAGSYWRATRIAAIGSLA